MIIERIVGRIADLGDRIKHVDPVELRAEKRQSPHLRLCSRDGRSVAVSLPRGEELFDGDVLMIEGDVAVVVKAAEEDLLEVSPLTPRQWGVAAYQLGNLHREARFLANSFLTPYDGIAESIMRTAGVPCRRVSRGFTGERFGAAGSTGHTHGDAGEHVTPHGHVHGHGSHSSNAHVHDDDRKH